MRRKLMNTFRYLVYKFRERVNDFVAFHTMGYIARRYVNTPEWGSIYYHSTQAFRMENDLHGKLVDMFEMQQELGESNENYALRQDAANAEITQLQDLRDKALVHVPGFTRCFKFSNVLEDHLFDIQFFKKEGKQDE